VEGMVKSIEYDPNRSARIALVYFKDGDKRYIVAPTGLKVGQHVVSGSKASPEIGNALFMRDIPLGTLIHNIELRPGQGAVMARSAGTYAQLAARDGDYAILKMPSGETRKVLSSCMAVIGTVSNPDHNKVSLGKAGASRWAGRRPRVRGVAMNPVDHPMGGGEGRASGGHPRSRKGLYAKGSKTRRKNHPTNKYIIEKRKK
jgi:large subunit ribosomal protein L2